MSIIKSEHLEAIAPIVQLSIDNSRGELKKMSQNLLNKYIEVFGDQGRQLLNLEGIEPSVK